MDEDDGIWDKSIGKVSVGNRRYFEMYTEAQILDGPLLRFSLLKSTIDSKTNEIFSRWTSSIFFFFYFTISLLTSNYLTNWRKEALEKK